MRCLWLSLSASLLQIRMHGVYIHERALYLESGLCSCRWAASERVRDEALGVGEREGRGRGGLVERVLWMGCVVCDGAIATGWEGWGSEGAGGPAGGYEGAEEEEEGVFRDTRWTHSDGREGEARTRKGGRGGRARSRCACVAVVALSSWPGAMWRGSSMRTAPNGCLWRPDPTHRGEGGRVRGSGLLTKQYAICTLHRSAVRTATLYNNNTLCTYAPAF